MNFRINNTIKILESLEYDSVLDVGCRRCDLKKGLNSSKAYFGCDLFQNDENLVDFVGDVMAYDFNQKFDVVTALDIVEHVDNPYILMDKLVDLSKKYVIISLPNIYDIQHKYNFVFKSTLGGKYYFGTENSLDRHRWVMNYDEINAFFQFYAKKYNMKLETFDVKLAENSTRLSNKLLVGVLQALLSKSNMTRTVIGIFKK